MSWSPEFQRVVGAGGRVEVRLGHPVVDLYLEFLAARCRPNTMLAAGFDLKVFFALFPVSAERSKIKLRHTRNCGTSDVENAATDSVWTTGGS